MIAYRNGYPMPPVCSPFDAENPAAANLLWLFYVSKVRSSLTLLILLTLERPVGSAFTFLLMANVVRDSNSVLSTGCRSYCKCLRFVTLENGGAGVRRHLS